MQHAKNVSVRTVRTVEFEFEEEKYYTTYCNIINRALQSVCQCVMCHTVQS